MKQVQKYTLIEYGRSLVQIFLHIVMSYPVRILYGTNRTLPENLNILNRGVLVVSNHQSMADPFVVLSHIPFRSFLKLVPLYFPVDNKEYNRFYFKPFLKVLGGYDIGETKKEKLIGLMRTRDFLKRGRTIFLFPEGKINKESIGDFQRGIEFFMQSSNGVIFVRMDGFGSYWDILTRKKPTMKFSQIYSFDTHPIGCREIRMLFEKI